MAKEYNYPVIWSFHPRTRSKQEKLSVELHPLIELCTPFDLFDFVKLEQTAFCVLTDSGTVQEECCIFHVPAVTLRDTTERPETVRCGSNILAGCDPDRIVRSVELVTQTGFRWDVPKEYVDPCVSDKVVRLILGNGGRTYLSAHA
jgi:UDP-N-acetylglucosamine 2-epimerase (non-hydrolysing)